MRVGGQLHAPAALPPRKRPGTHYIGDWVGPRAGLGAAKISPPPRFDPRNVFNLYITEKQCGIYDSLLSAIFVVRAYKTLISKGALS
jgi:hypothetical protein